MGSSSVAAAIAALDVYRYMAHQLGLPLAAARIMGGLACAVEVSYGAFGARRG